MVWRPSFSSLLTPAISAKQALDLPRGHIPALDSVRGLAILVVTLYRFGGGGDGPARAIDHVWLIDMGQRGVDLFFVLSGFLITGILFDSKSKPRFFRNFYARRALRIFPLYYGVLAFAVLLLPLLTTAGAVAFQPAIDAQAWLWLYGANVLQAIRGEWCLGAFNHFWSLAIEEHFYFLWPAIIYFTSRRTAMRACVGIFAASIVSRGLWLASGGNDVAAEALTLLRMDGLVLGSWLALAARSPNGLGRIARWSLPTLLTFGTLAIAADALGRRLFGLPYAFWACASGAALILIVAASPRRLLSRIGNSQVLQFFGKYSYGIYVFQLPLIYLLAPVVTAGGLAAVFGSAALGQLAYCILLLGITTLAALVSWHAFEKRLLALKHRFGG